MPSWEQYLQRIHPDDRAALKAASDRAIAEKSDYDIEFRIVVQGGVIKFLHAVGEPVFGPTRELQQFVGVVMDVTESRRTEEERERLRRAQAELTYVNRVSTMGELTASLAHEIKQPIGAAVTNAEACFRLLDRDQPDILEAREAALEMVKDARRAADIIDRVRLLYQKGSSQLVAVEVNEVIQEMVMMLQNEANRHSITIRTDLARGLPRVTADRVQLQQVLMNLILNSIEAMRGISGELHIKSQLADGSQLLIRSAIPAWDCRPRIPSKSSTRFSRRSLKVRDWDWPLPVPLWKRMVDVFGPLRTPTKGQHSISRCPTEWR